MCTCHDACLEVRGQLSSGVGSLLSPYVDLGDQTQVIRLACFGVGGKPNSYIHGNLGQLPGFSPQYRNSCPWAWGHYVRKFEGHRPKWWQATWIPELAHKGDAVHDSPERHSVPDPNLQMLCFTAKEGQQGTRWTVQDAQQTCRGRVPDKLQSTTFLELRELRMPGR